MFKNIVKTAWVSILISLSHSTLAGTINSNTPSSTLITPLSKTYQLLNLENVAINPSSCQVVYNSLKALQKQSLTFQFTSNDAETSTFKLNDQTNQIQNHNYSIIEQKVEGTRINRIGMGSFTLNHQLIQYIIVITADTSQKDFNYVYPLILTSNDVRCHFMAILKPDANTTETFKKNINKGAVANKADLTN